MALNRRVLRQIADAAAGNPLFAIELGRALESRGPPQIGEHVTAPEALEDLVGARVAGLPDGPRRVLLAVALSTDLRLPQLAAVADQRAIDDAIDAGLLAIERDRVRASHPLLGAAARADASTRERRELHLALADAVDREHRPVHLALAADTPDAGLAATVAEAAARAAARTHAEEAAMLAEHALRLTPPGDPERTDRLLTLTRWHVRRRPRPRRSSGRPPATRSWACAPTPPVPGSRSGAPSGASASGAPPAHRSSARRAASTRSARPAGRNGPAPSSRASARAGRRRPASSPRPSGGWPSWRRRATRTRRSRRSSW